jgi:hypothetical protein
VYREMMGWTPIRNPGDLARRLGRASVEQGQLDFKREYDLTRLSIRYDMAKDVAAFATAYGGTILVGICWNNQQVVGLRSVTDPQRTVAELSTALQQYCVPVPPTPDEQAIVVSVAAATQILPPGAQPPAADATILAINVDPDPRGPIAVRAELNGQPHADTYRFPIRVGDQTDFLDPGQLAMWMNSNERRVAIRLRQVLSHGPVLIRIHHRIGYSQQGKNHRVCELLDLDESRMHIVVGQRENQNLQPPFTVLPQATVKAHVPLTYVSSVWEDPHGVTEIAVNGTLFSDFDPIRPFTKPVFVPYLGGA